jgi:phage repressor protein C with HTH and peptisase S24 domain
MNEDDKKLYENAKKCLKIGNLEQLAEILGYAKTSVNNWYKSGFSKIVRMKIAELIAENDIDTIHESTYTSSNIVKIPYFEDTYGAMGVGGVSHDDHPSVMTFDKTFLSSIFGISNFKNIHIINAVGDSMSPTISSGELLFVNPFENEDSRIKDRGVYVIVSPNGILVKRIKIHPTKNQWILVSDNPTDADIQLCEDELTNCTIVGRVVGHFDRI